MEFNSGFKGLTVMWLLVNGLIQNVRNLRAMAHGFLVFFRLSCSTEIFLTVDCVPSFVLNPRCVEAHFVNCVLPYTRLLMIRYTLV